VPNARIVLCAGLLMGLAAAVTGCERALAPRRNPLAELRLRARGELGNFNGRVLTRDTAVTCWRSQRGVPGVRVELGLWDGSPAFYRDTVRGTPPSDLADPRFHLIDSTSTAEDGRFRFVGLPRDLPYAVRIIPPRGSPWKSAYGVSMYGIPREGEMRDFPMLCVEPR
jgi:hypothetical protein